MHDPVRSAQQLFDAALQRHKTGDLEAAKAGYRQVIAVDFRHADAIHWLGVACAQQGDMEEAERLISRAAALRPEAALYWCNLGNVLKHRGRKEDARSAYDKALAIAPAIPDALYNRANLFFESKLWVEALKDYEAAYNAGKRDLDTVCCIEECLLLLRRFDDVLALAERVRAAQPSFIPNLLQRCYALGLSARYEEAIAACDAILAIEPKNAKAMGAKALWLTNAGSHATAEHLARSALSLGDTDGYAGKALGLALTGQNKFAQALETYNQLLQQRPSADHLYQDRGYLNRLMQRYEDAIADFEQVLSLEGGANTEALAGLLDCKTAVCDWAGLAQHLDTLHRELLGSTVANAAACTSLIDEPRSLAKVGRDNIQNFVGRGQVWSRSSRDYGPRFRIGYLSSDFGDHAVGYQIAEMIALHDRDRFEVLGFSNRPADQSPVQREILAAFDHVETVFGLGDDELAQHIAAAKLDVMIDLNGHTKGNRLRAIKDRPAPVQVTFLGYPATTSAAFIDYVVADKIVLPPSELEFWTEKPIWMSHTYFVNDRRRRVDTAAVTRMSEGLPDDAFVFACFNGHRKIMPWMFDVWMELLRAVDAAVLWLAVTEERARDALRREAVGRNVSSDRLIFCGHVDQHKYLARQHLADLFLDTLPYNAHSTGSVALWGGLPIITCRGNTFAGRVGASLLTALDMPELIAENLNGYKKKAIRFANDRDAARAIRHKLQQNRERAPLFDTPRFTADFERGLTAIIERDRRGEPPDVIDLTPSVSTAA